MKTAQEANLQTYQAKQSKAASELEAIEKAILNAVTKGKYIVWFNGVLSNAATEVLYSKGYTEVQTQDRNESCYIISW